VFDFAEDSVVNAAFIAEAEGGFSFEAKEFAENFAVAGELFVRSSTALPTQADTVHTDVTRNGSDSNETSVVTRLFCTLTQLGLIFILRCGSPRAMTYS
jgi:hypothetical protein